MTTHGRRRDERGITTIEVVLSAPALLLALMMIIQYALFFHAQAVALAAAEEGAAQARRYDGTAASAHAEAVDYLDRLGSGMFTGHRVEVTRTAQRATVTVSGTVISLVPGMDLRVDEHAGGPVERFVPHL